ncbi:UTP--glucose-1-phosphate uridylyltransferase GalU [Eubacteriales bacterium OttesenSCG-928-G02]|nr:UTP--glucose-1-phosphate uridylyltransferase GalU [Eubacteriales bacterium OttesenSCG-928-G02]
MKITKAVIPAAGLGTRMLPISKSVPKEMLPIVDKPAIQYLVEEAVNSGITDILIITGRGKEAIENHFDHSLEYYDRLEKSGKHKTLDELKSIANLANITFIRQKEAKGLGHAIMCAKSFIGDQPFSVLYGDDIIISETPVTKQLIDVYNEHKLPVVGVKTVTEEQIVKYCSLKVDNIRDNIYKVHDMIEKPSRDKIYSMLSILGRVLLTPEIFDILERTAPGAGGEIQLTDAMNEYTKLSGLTACEFEGTRYDMGSKSGFITANIDMALKHPETSEDIKAYIKKIASEI